MMMRLVSIEDADFFSYAAIVAASYASPTTKPSGRANAIRTSWNATFGGGHSANVHAGLERVTDVPSGHIFESSEHVIGNEGCSTEFRYTNPPIPMTIISRTPMKRFLIDLWYHALLFI